MNKPYRMTFLLALLAMFALSGCSSKRPTPIKVYWPPPPAESKMEWITTFSSEDNFPKTEGQLRTEKFLGKKQFNYFKKPMGVAADSRGLVYVADMDAGNIQVIDFSAAKMAPYTETPSVGLPIGLAFDSQDSLYVADGYGKQILVFNARRELVRSIGAGEFGKPTFIAVNEALGRLYVSDVVKHEVIVFDLASGKKLFAFGGKGTSAGDLYGPQGLAIDKDGRVFVAEQFNVRVQVFDADGKHLYMFGNRGDQAFQFEGPRGLAFDSQSNLFVAETRKAAVLIFKPDGVPLTALGGARTGHQLGFTLPTTVYIDRNDRVYISDGMNKRITIWQMLTPAYLAEHPLDVEALQKIEEKVLRLQKEKRTQ
jgi:DNA-binding beta-propeller fold protein YncE